MRSAPGSGEGGQTLGKRSPNPNHAVLHVLSSKITDLHFSLWPRGALCPRKDMEIMLEKYHGQHTQQQNPLKTFSAAWARQQPGCPMHTLLSTFQLLPWWQGYQAAFFFLEFGSGEELPCTMLLWGSSC